MRTRAGSSRRLTNDTLLSHGQTVEVPTYDRRALKPGIVHIGVGGFHRSHQAMYLDELAERRVTNDWGVVGVGLRRRHMKDALSPQDCLYTVVERGAEGDAARVIGSVKRCLFAPEEPEAVLAALTDADTRLVTLTVTGGAYELDEQAPEIAADLAHPDRPGTFYGYLVEALDRRRRSGSGPFTVLSCDNIPRNGIAARNALLSFARMRDEVLARWIEDNVAFPGSMVDRITPQTTASDRGYLAERFGVDDRWPVVTEPFTQWVVEDEFCNGRPPLEEVGVQFVTDVGPYKLMKTRLLNASHSALGYLGYLAGHRRTDEAMRDPLLREYVRRLMDDEVTPLLPELGGIDVEAYKRTLLRRFANPQIGDQLERLCSRGSTKMPAYLLPSASEAVLRGRPYSLLALAVAGWLRYLRGVDFSGRPIEVNDAMHDKLSPLAREGGSDPRLVMRSRAVFGELGRNAEFVGAVERALVTLDEHGPHGALRRQLGQAVASPV